MTDLIVQREDVEIQGVPYRWMVAADQRGLGLETCGCDKCAEFPPDKIVEQKDYGHLVVVTFAHHRPDNMRWFCSMAFEHPEMKPLTFDEYMAHFPATDDLDKD
jgi:hypothetical protein